METRMYDIGTDAAGNPQSACHAHKSEGIFFTLSDCCGDEWEGFSPVFSG